MDSADLDFLRYLGVGRVAYLRSFDDVSLAHLIPGAVADPGEITFILFGADGELLSFYDHVAAAVMAAAERDLALATVH